MTTLDIETAPAGPPPVATRHDHQGSIVTKIERPAPEVIAICRSLYTGLVLDHLGKHGSMTPDMKPVWSGAFPAVPQSPVSEPTGASGPWPPTSPSPATSSCSRRAA